MGISPEAQLLVAVAGGGFGQPRLDVGAGRGTFGGLSVVWAALSAYAAVPGGPDAVHSAWVVVVPVEKVVPPGAAVRRGTKKISTWLC
jgi:hypothetical protein